MRQLNSAHHDAAGGGGRGVPRPRRLLTITWAITDAAQCATRCPENLPPPLSTECADPSECVRVRAYRSATTGGCLAACRRGPPIAVNARGFGRTADAVDCYCPAGHYYARQWDKCVPCAKGAACAVGAKRLQYWLGGRAPIARTILLCRRAPGCQRCPARRRVVDVAESPPRWRPASAGWGRGPPACGCAPDRCRRRPFLIFRCRIHIYIYI